MCGYCDSKENGRRLLENPGPAFQKTLNEFLLKKYGTRDVMNIDFPKASNKTRSPSGIQGSFKKILNRVFASIS